MMAVRREREYLIDISPRILELLGPHLYTNIYYVLAELIANSYDAGATNVYITEKENSITVEDDGKGMSYEKGDIRRYLGVAVETRKTTEESYIRVGKEKRRKMGRKGIGKLAALSVSENVSVMTIQNGEKSGFILTRHVEEDKKLKPLLDEEIKFDYVKTNGTSVVMTNPQYGMNKTAKAIKNNLLKIFPLVNKNFQIHIITPKEKVEINDFDKEMIGNLGALVIFGKEFFYLSKYFDSELKNKACEKELVHKGDVASIPLKLKDKEGKLKDYNLKIKGWIGIYKTTKGRKIDPNDFPDNFISLLSNGKLGEYNILPSVGKNWLQEVYLVGQLHIDLFEETELPDMSLSNRQGYKIDDERYQKTLSFVRGLVPKIIKLRLVYAKFRDKENGKDKYEKQKKEEVYLKGKIENYKKTISENITKKITEKFKVEMPEGTQKLIADEMNQLMPLAGFKKKIDSEKKKILISHTGADKPLGDIIQKMLSFNGIPEGEIIYTNSDSDECWVPHGKEVWEYLRDFFVDSYSDKKIYVIYVTSNEMAKSWAAVSEVGAGWITQSKHDIFNVSGHTPKPPLNTGLEWHTSKKENDKIIMGELDFEKFIVKIIDICKDLGYAPKEKEINRKELSNYVVKE